MEVELTFVPTFSINNGSLEVLALPYLTERIEEIFAFNVVYPYKILEIYYVSPTEIRVIISIDNPNQLVEALEEISYELTDADIIRLGIAPPQNIAHIGQDVWAQGDLYLDDETLRALGLQGSEVEFYPILTKYHILS